MNKLVASMNQNSSRFKYLMPLSMLFCTILIAANFAAHKPIVILGLVLPGGIFIFPLSYIVGDIVSEIYGYKWTRRMIFYAVLCNLLMTGYIQWVISLDAVESWPYTEAFRVILQSSWLIFSVSTLSFLLSESTNAYFISKLKVMTNGRYYWARATSSTIIAVTVDNLIFLPLVFYHSVDIKTKLYMSFCMFLVKISYEFVLLPVSAALVGYLKKLEGVNTYDYNTNYSLFSWDVNYNEVELKGEPILKGNNLVHSVV